MSISEADVRHIAALSRVGVPADRVPQLVSQLNGILEHMDVLQRVQLPDTIEQTVVAMPLRPDVPGSVALARAREDFAPAMRDGFFLVPRLATHDAVGASEDE